MKKKKLLLKKVSKEILKKSKEKVVKRKEISISDLIPTGSTLLNLACADNAFAGYSIGKIMNIIGDSSAGKSFLAFTTFAEMSKLSRFDDYQLVYDDVESSCEFDIEYLFGKKVEDRIDTGFETFTIEDFYDNIYYLLDQGYPFVYVLDSFDALTSEAGIRKAEENRKLRAKGKETKGSYGDGKPKAFSDFCKLTANKLVKARSTIIVVSQTRDNLGFGAMFTPKTRAGGKALKFYSCHEMWLSVGKAETKKDRKIGNLIQTKITKNKLTGKHRTITFPLFYDYGIDDIHSCIDFLMKEKHWSGTLKKIKAVDFEFEGSSNELILHIEQNEMEDDLKKLTGEVWIEIEESIRMKHRKRKY